MPRVLQLVRGQSQDSDLGSGALGFSPSSAPSQEVTATFLERGDTVLEAGAFKQIKNSDRVWLPASAYVIMTINISHSVSGDTARRMGGGAVFPQHGGQALSASRVLPIPSRCLPPPHCAKCCDSVRLLGAHLDAASHTSAPVRAQRPGRRFSRGKSTSMKRRPWVREMF